MEESFDFSEPNFPQESALYSVYGVKYAGRRVVYCRSF